MWSTDLSIYMAYLVVVDISFQLLIVHSTGHMYLSVVVGYESVFPHTVDHHALFPLKQ